MLSGSVGTPVALVTLRAAAAELFQRAMVHEAVVGSDTGRELRQGLEGEVVGHALPTFVPRFIDGHGAVAVHDLQADPRRHVGDITESPTVWPLRR